MPWLLPPTSESYQRICCWSRSKRILLLKLSSDSSYLVLISSHPPSWFFPSFGPSSFPSSILPLLLFPFLFIFLSFPGKTTPLHPSLNLTLIKFVSFGSLAQIAHHYCQFQSRACVFAVSAGPRFSTQTLHTLYLPRHSQANSPPLKLG